MTRCSYSWKTDTPCPKHPGTGRHQCKRQNTHDPSTVLKAHECRCGAQRAVVTKRKT